MNPKYKPINSFQNGLEPWSIRETDFPKDGSTLDKLRFLIGYAMLAPSCFNAQPWTWQEDGDAMRLYLDPRHASPQADFDERQMLIGCGAALVHLRVAIQHFGYEAKVEYFPKPGDAFYLARVALGNPRQPTADDNVLFHAIPKRHTYRGLFQPKEIDAPILKALQYQAEAEGVWLQMVENSADREALLGLIVEGDLEQWNSSQFCRENAHWLRGSKDPARDGIPAPALGFNNLESHLLPLALRQPVIARLIQMGEMKADRDWLLVGGAPVLGIIGTAEDRDSPRDYLSVGEALGRVLLRGCAEGLAFSFFNSPVELFHFWPRIFQIIHHKGFLHLIFRVGYPIESPTPTPRKMVQDVLVS